MILYHGSTEIVEKPKIISGDKFLDFGYGFVRGPVANDTLYRIIVLYESGILNFEETVKRLKVNELFDQLSFHSDKALENLIFRGIESLT